MNVFAVVYSLFVSYAKDREITESLTSNLGQFTIGWSDHYMVAEIHVSAG